jgi:hypothetical protein
LTTVVVGTNAKGDILPPMTICAAKNVNNQLTQGGSERSTYNCSANGWIIDDPFAFWFNNVFLVETRSLSRPILLILDGHHSHFTIQVIEAAKSNDVVILYLPLHCTHGLQPLDLVTFE